MNIVALRIKASEIPPTTPPAMVATFVVGADGAGRCLKSWIRQCVVVQVRHVTHVGVDEADEADED
jgi:hypothetical protein